MGMDDTDRNREAVAALTDGTLVAIWFDGDTAPRVCVVHGGRLDGPSDHRQNTSDTWANGHAWHFDRMEVIWKPPVDHTARIIAMLDGIPVEPGWLLDMLGERGLTICERSEAA